MIIERKRSPALDEERDHDLDALNELLDGRIRQFPCPYFEIAAPASISFNTLSRRPEVSRCVVVLYARVEVVRLLKGDCKVLISSVDYLLLRFSLSGTHSFNISSMCVALVSPTALNLFS